MARLTRAQYIEQASEDAGITPTILEIQVAEFKAREAEYRLTQDIAWHRLMRDIARDIQAKCDEVREADRAKLRKQ